MDGRTLSAILRSKGLKPIAKHTTRIRGYNTYSKGDYMLYTEKAFNDFTYPNGDEYKQTQEKNKINLELSKLIGLFVKIIHMYDDRFDFRVWEKNAEIMHGCITKIDFLISGEPIRAVAFDGLNETGMHAGYDRDKKFILMQYIGLSDKNNKRIYEGDIGEVKTEQGRLERFIVEWGIHRREMASGWTVDIPSFAFMIGMFPSFPIVDNYVNGHDLDIIEIVGNIFQTPELIPHIPYKTL